MKTNPRTRTMTGFDILKMSEMLFHETLAGKDDDNSRARRKELRQHLADIRLQHRQMAMIARATNRMPVGSDTLPNYKIAPAGRELKIVEVAATPAPKKLGKAK